MSDNARVWTSLRMHPWAHGQGRRRLRSLLLAGAVAAGAAATAGVGSDVLAGGTSPDFGPNVLVFSPSMPQSTIQAEVNAIADQQVGNQFGSQRYALLFEPGTYGSKADPLVFQVGFYTEVAGLGLNPGDVVVNGAIDVFNQCFGAVKPDGGGTNCVALDNFWRSLSNLTLNVTTGSSTPDFSPVVPDTYDYCTAGASGCSGTPAGSNGLYNPGCNDGNEFWATSQAAPIRRVDFNGFVTLFDYCGDQDYSSGGFIADSELNGGVLNGSQQQFLIRNSSIAFDTNSVWNQVFSGVSGAPPTNFDAGGQYTTLATSPVTREEPYLYQDGSGAYSVFVPAVQHDTSGVSWAHGSTPGTSIPISRFFIASPSTRVDSINAALARHLNLILTPGVYDLSGPIVIPHPDTIVMGMGFATLVPQTGQPAMIAVRNHGVEISGLIFDAGPRTSPVLLSVGTPGEDRDSAGDPDTIQDVFFRIGGAETTPVSAEVSLLDNAESSIIDNIWAWRADHGNAVGWTVNRGATGVVVTGDDVTAYGLAVEHYQKYEVIWSGNNGTDIFFQNELPYDPPSQADWMATPSQDGYPAFFVTHNVRSFNGYGMGSYVVFIQTAAPVLYDAEAYESSDAPGVRFHDILTVWIAGSGGDLSVIDGHGGPDTSTNPGKVVPVDVVSYP
jgi:hypothetical protein